MLQDPPASGPPWPTRARPRRCREMEGPKQLQPPHPQPLGCSPHQLTAAGPLSAVGSGTSLAPRTADQREGSPEGQRRGRMTQNMGRINGGDISLALLPRAE